MVKFDDYYKNLSEIEKIVYQQAEHQVFFSDKNRAVNELFKINKIVEADFYRQKCIELQIKLAEHEGQATERDKIINRLTIESKINHMESKISPDAYNLLKNNPEFLNTIQPDELVDCTVLAIDIRRSTELMLKAKSPEDFSNFIRNLSIILNKIIILNYGIFDKFTGDGVLAFFPKCFTGEDSIFHTIKAAQECHNAFNEHYEKSHHLFETILLDTGLGIGIDYGPIKIVKIANDITVVGKPVVYACRLSSANGGDTLLNQSAFDEVEKKSKSKIKFIHKKVVLEIKHEGPVLTHKVNIDFSSSVLQDPAWQTPTLAEHQMAQPASQTTSPPDAAPGQPQPEPNNQPSDNPESQS